MNLFEKAARLKLRFPTEKGALTAEQLWDLPLTSAKNLSLNGIGTSYQKALREMGEDSLIDTGSENAAKAEAKLRLDIVKRVIDVKLAENAEASKANANKAEKEKLLEILARKQDAALESMSADELKARIEAL